MPAHSPAAPLDQLPGFRRRFRITPDHGWVQSEVEDDFHCMSVIVRHDGATAVAIEPHVRRAPWSTCPGAEEQLKKTFTGVALSEFVARGEKQANCTHLHDLAMLAAAHAFDGEALIYDILVSDPVDGRRRAEIRRDAQTVLGWTESGFRIVEPAWLAGMTLDNLRTWMASLDLNQQEAVRLLRWANMIANGRIIPLDKQSDATAMPPSCYTFQPSQAAVAKRVGLIRDFSGGLDQPLG